MTLDKAQVAIAAECDALKETLLTKNFEYGNAALEPLDILCEPDAALFIRVRISDKLKRLQQLRKLPGYTPKIAEDTLLDIAGYLILLRVAERDGSCETSDILFEGTEAPGGELGPFLLRRLSEGQRLQQYDI